MGRILGIDYGRRRIGLAISDVGEALASPLTTLEANGNAEDDARKVVEVADAEDATAFVVGLPLNMDGTEGPQAKLTRAFGARLERGAPGRPVTFWDERLSSFAADQLLAQADLTRAKRKKRRDPIAAQVVLQAYLDARGDKTQLLPPSNDDA